MLRYTLIIVLTINLVNCKTVETPMTDFKSCAERVQHLVDTCYKEFQYDLNEFDESAKKPSCCLVAKFKKCVHRGVIDSCSNKLVQDSVSSMMSAMIDHRCENVSST